MQNFILATSARRPRSRRVAEDFLELSLLGALGVHRAGRPLELGLPPDAVRLLAYLLLNRERVIPRAEAAAALWSADNEPDARANLRRTLQLLTRTLPASTEPWIITTAASIAWNAGAPYRLDVDEFERLCVKKTAREAADARYTDHLLVALDDDWVVRERNRLRTLATENLLAMLSVHQQRREFAAAIRCAQRLSTLDPSRKNAVGAIVTVRRDSGEPPAPPDDAKRENSGAKGEPAPPVAERPPNIAAGSGEIPFVGRERETNMLRGAWIETMNGNGSAHIVIGDAGSGKARLLDEFATFVAANGGRVLRAAASATESAPYAALSEALRAAVPLLRETTIESTALAVLATIVPQLCGAPGELAPVVPLEPEPDRTRLIAAVVSMLAAAAAVHPVALIIEDLERAGSATIALLERAARHAPAHRLLIVTSYAQERLSRMHPLHAFRTRLERERLLHPIDLAPLQLSAVADLVVHARSNGNPSALEQIIADDRDRGTESVRAADYYCSAAERALAFHSADEARALAARARELARDAATRFRATAVIEEAARRQADRAAQRDAVTQLRALADEIDDPELRREALRRTIVLMHERAERPAENAALAELEPLVRGAGTFWEATYARLRAAHLAAAGSNREARAMLAGALGAISRERYPLLYARTWCALIDPAVGGGQEKDIRAFLDAAPSFEAVYGSEAAPLLLETACIAAGRIRDYAALIACAERLRRCSLEIGYSEGAAAADAYAGRAARRLFRVGAALSALQRSSAQFASIGQPMKALQIQSEIGSLRATVGQFDDAIETFEGAAATAALISFRFGHVAALNGISYTASLKGDLTRARAAALEALGIADSIGSRSGRAHALVSIGVAQREAGELAVSIEQLEAGTTIERELNEWPALGMDLCELIVALLRHHRIERAMQLADEVLALANNPLLHFSLSHVLLGTVAAVRHANGDRARAGALLAQARRALDEITAAIEDEPIRENFRCLPFNRAIDDAFERDDWRF